MTKQVLSDTMTDERNERLRLALDVSQIAVWDWDVGSNAVFYSKEWKQMRGISEDEGWDSPNALWNSVHPDERSEREKQKALWLEGRNDHFESEYRVQHSSGSWVKISERVKVVRDSAGKVSRLVGAEKKITPQYVSQPSSKLGVNSFEILSDELPIATARFEGNKCVYVNETWSHLTGFSFESALGDGYLDAIPPDERARIVEIRQRYIHGPPGETIVVNGIEGRYLKSDGSVGWFLTQLRMQYAADGTLADNTATLIEITDRKKLEQQQERLLAILESTSDFVCMATVERIILWCNAPFSKFRPDLDPRKGANCMDKYSTSSKKIMDDIAIPAAIENGSWSGEVNLLDSNGDEVPVSQVLVAHKAEDGSVEYFSVIMRDVRELKTANFALHASENKFASLVAASPVAIFEMDALKEKCLYLNDRWSELSGRPKEAGLGTGYRDAIHPDDLPKLMESRFDPEESFETRHLLPDGSVKWVLGQTEKMLDEDGNVTGHMGTLTDITKLKEADENLRAMKDRLQLVLEGASVGTFEYQPADDKLIWDDRMMEIYGVCPEEFSGRSEDFYQRVPPKDVQRREADYEALLESGQNTSEFEIIRPDGDRRHILAEQLVLKNDQDEIEKVIGLCIDITHQRTTQLELQETQTQLRVMTDNIPSMLFRYVRHPDGTHEFPFVSSGSRDVFGVEPQDAIEDAESLFQKVHQEDAPELAQRIAESHENLTPFKSEYRIDLAEKGLRWVQAISSPSVGDDGAVFWDGLAIDITQRKEAEIELQKAKMKDEFLANVSHELRTPLNAMLGMTEGLKEGIFGALTSEQRKSLKVIEHSGDHLLGLINEMLDLAKIESGQLKLVFSAVDVRELCESSMRFVAHQAEKKNIQLNVELPFNIPNIKLDEQRIRQVLINLLGNAVKFTPDGGCVTVKFERIVPTGNDQEKTLRVAVTDTGIGIESSKLDSLFVPFVQVDSSLNRNYEGTGLGLALVKQYVELHGGQVAVNSEPGVGSCFEFSLPYREAAADDLSEQELRLESPNGATSSDQSDCADASPLVLLAEDNEDIALATSSFLKASGFRVLHATDGAIAVQMAVKHAPDIILMDIQMPGVDGLEAMERLRKIPEHSETPIIAVTGLARQFDAKRCTDAGANEYLCKPYRMADLVTTICRILGKQSSV